MEHTHEEKPMEEPSHELLLEEYKAAQQKVEFHSRMAWQIGGIFIAGVIAGFSVFASKLSEIDQLQELFGLFLAGAFSVIIFELWFRIYRRWDTYNLIAHHRAQEIEKALNLHLNLDIDLLDIELECDRQRKQPLDEDDTQRLEQLKHWLSERNFLGKAERKKVYSSVKCIRWTIVVGWILLFVFALLQYLCKWFISVFAIFCHFAL